MKFDHSKRRLNRSETKSTFAIIPLERLLENVMSTIQSLRDEKNQFKKNTSYILHRLEWYAGTIIQLLALKEDQYTLTSTDFDVINFYSNVGVRCEKNIVRRGVIVKKYTPIEIQNTKKYYLAIHKTIQACLAQMISSPDGNFESMSLFNLWFLLENYPSASMAFINKNARQISMLNMIVGSLKQSIGLELSREYQFILLNRLKCQEGDKFYKSVIETKISMQISIFNSHLQFECDEKGKTNDPKIDALLNLNVAIIYMVDIITALTLADETLLDLDGYLQVAIIVENIYSLWDYSNKIADEIKWRMNVDEDENLSDVMSEMSLSAEASDNAILMKYNLEKTKKEKQVNELLVRIENKEKVYLEEFIALLKGLDEASKEFERNKKPGDLPTEDLIYSRAITHFSCFEKNKTLLDEEFIQIASYFLKLIDFSHLDKSNRRRASC